MVLFLQIINFNKLWTDNKNITFNTGSFYYLLLVVLFLNIMFIFKKRVASVDVLLEN